MSCTRLKAFWEGLDPRTATAPGSGSEPKETSLDRPSPFITAIAAAYRVSLQRCHILASDMNTQSWAAAW